MYFNYQLDTYCLNCDWLQYSVLLPNKEPELVCPGDYRIEICQGNNIFEHRAVIYDGRGCKFITMLWAPYSSVLNELLATIQVANEYLYMNGEGIKWSWDLVQEMIDGVTFNAIGRVDICIDFNCSAERWKFLTHLNSGHYYAERKTEGSSWWHEIESADGFKKRRLHCLSFGSKSSEIKVKIYYKSREQGLLGGAEPDKPWIVNEWKVAGLDIKNVWRMEFSLAGCGQLTWKGNKINLENVTDNQWLVDVFFECYHKRFVTRLNQGRKVGHHNNDERVYLLNLPVRGFGLKWKETAGTNYDIPAAITLLRGLMRNLDNPAMLSNRIIWGEYADMVSNVVRAYRLDGYFKRTYNDELEAYLQKMSESVDVGIRVQCVPPNRLMD